MHVSTYNDYRHYAAQFNRRHETTQEKRSDVNNVRYHQFESVPLLPHCPPELQKSIREGGIGYMANTQENRDKLNVKVVTIHPKRVGNASIFLIASKPIKAGEEIFSPYNNAEAKLAALLGD